MDDQPDAEEDGYEQCEPEGDQEAVVLLAHVLDVADGAEARS